MNDRQVVALILGITLIGGIGSGIHNERNVTIIEDDDKMRVATLNVHQWYNGLDDGRFVFHSVRDALLQTNADIIALQETEGARITSSGQLGVDWLGKELGMYAIHGPATKEMVYGVALLSRWPIQGWHVAELPTAEDTIERVALVATVAHPDGLLRVFVPHFEIEEYPEVRVEQAEWLVRAMPERSIALGDFNTPARLKDPAYAVLAGNLTDAWLDAGQDASAGTTYPATGPTTRIDHIWLRGFTAYEAGTFGSPEVSDHRGVWAEIAIA